MEQKSVSLHPGMVPFKRGTFVWRLRIGNEWHLCWTFCDVWRVLQSVGKCGII